MSYATVQKCPSINSTGYTIWYEKNSTTDTTEASLSQAPNQRTNWCRKLRACGEWKFGAQAGYQRVPRMNSIGVVYDQRAAA
jgi:hypothetical protein